MRAAVCLGSLVTALSLSAQENRSAPRPAAVSEAHRGLLEAVATIEARYLTELSQEQLLDRALRVLLRDLDPYSSWLDQEEWTRTGAELDAEFGGVGTFLELDPELRLPRIRYLLLGSAAEAAGARRGDLLLAIDGRSVAGLPLEAVLPRLRGVPGSTVELTLKRAATEAVLRLSVERAIVKTPSVRGVRRNRRGEPDYLLDPDRGIGYIRIANLARDTVPAVEAALIDLERRGMKALVLDLRDSRGGLMMAAIGVADLFLQSGLIVAQVSRHGSWHHLAQPGCYTDFPMVVLINAETASSSEFLAAALSDNGRAIFVGERTFGKARIQERVPLSAGPGGLVLTTGIFVRPSGETVDRNDDPGALAYAGVVPDAGLEVVVAGEEYEAWADAAWLQDAAFLLDEADELARPPDRPLLRAVEMLERSLSSTRP